MNVGNKVTGKKKVIGKKVFSIYKIRSMTERKEVVGEKVVPASTSDARITKTGNFIRRTRIDEIPQLINVVKGDMSLIGPRALALPQVQEFIEENINFKYRFNIKAGVTGYAKVM